MPHSAIRVGVDLVEAARVGERRGPVAELALDVEQLARLAAAVAEVPVGEDQRGDAGVREPARVGLEPVLAGAAEAVAEDHQRRALGVGHEQPGAALVAGGGEGDVESRAGFGGHWAEPRDLSLLCQLSVLGCRSQPTSVRSNERPHMTTTTQNHRLGIEVEQRGRVLLARLQGGPRGEFGPEIAADLAALVTRAETDEGVGAVVITGTHPERFVAHAEPALAAGGGRREPERRAARRLGGRAHGPRHARRCPACASLADRTPLSGAMELLGRARDVHCG